MPFDLTRRANGKSVAGYAAACLAVNRGETVLFETLNPKQDRRCLLATGKRMGISVDVKYVGGGQLQVSHAV